MYISAETVSVAVAFTLLGLSFNAFIFLLNLTVLVVPSDMVRVCANTGYEWAFGNRTPSGYLIMPTVLAAVMLVMQALPIVMFGIAAYALRGAIPCRAVWHGDSEESSGSASSESTDDSDESQ